MIHKQIQTHNEDALEYNMNKQTLGSKTETRRPATYIFCNSSLSLFIIFHFFTFTFSPPLRPEERDRFHQKRKPVCPPLEIAKQKIFNIPPSSLPPFHHIHHFFIIFSLAKNLDIWHYFYQIQVPKCIWKMCLKMGASPL